jgi:glycosyltransferase involved in cell wall biosynthesis
MVLGKVQLMNELISVVVPVYNAEKYLYKCIESILKQTHSNLELIIIDDNSTDNSTSVINRIKDPRVRVFKNNRRQGSSVSRNIGIAHASGKYITFIDADDFVDKNYIMNFNKSKVLSCCNLICTGHKHYYSNNTFKKVDIHDPEDSLILSEEYIYNYISKYLYLSYEYLMFVHCWAKLYDLHFIRKHNLLFNVKLCYLEDVDFNFKYLKNKPIVGFAVGDGYHYNIGNTNSMTKGDGQNRNSEQKMLVSINSVKKYIEGTKISLKGLSVLTYNTLIITALRVARNFINYPNYHKLKTIYSSLKSKNLYKNVQFYKPNKKESYFIHYFIKKKMYTGAMIATLVHALYLEKIK